MQCPVHKVEFKLVPAGVSKKTGKPYPAFSACPEYGCNQKPDSSQESQVTAPSKEYNGKPQEFWDTRSNVIALCGMVNAAIGAGKEITPTLIDSYGKTLQAIQKKAEELIDLPF